MNPPDPALAGPQIRDIVPPMVVPLLPLWAVIALTVLGTLLVCGIIWWFWKRRRQRVTPPLPPREVALAGLQALEPQLADAAPTDCTVAISTVLRTYVMGQFGIPATRQTSQEFLQSLQSSPFFSPAEREHLRAFLDRCDLITFARWEAGSGDSRELWTQARAFVAGGLK